MALPIGPANDALLGGLLGVASVKKHRFCAWERCFSKLPEGERCSDLIMACWRRRRSAWFIYFEDGEHLDRCYL